MRVKWSKELHEAFDRAVAAQGGLYFATPSSIFEEMRKTEPEITVWQLKSFLQYRRALDRGTRRSSEKTGGGGATEEGGAREEGTHGENKHLCNLELGLSFHRADPPQRPLALSPIARAVQENNKAIVDLFYELSAGDRRLIETLEVSNRLIDLLMSNSR